MTNLQILLEEKLLILCSFYDENSKTKSIQLIDCSVLKICDHNSIIILTNSILKTYEKVWSDVIAISTDSASYALKYAQGIKETQNFNIHHINDISHLIHVAVIHGFKSNKMRALREIIISFGNLFLNANKMNEEFKELLEKTLYLLRNLNKLLITDGFHITEHHWISLNYGVICISHTLLRRVVDEI